MQKKVLLPALLLISGCSTKQQSYRHEKDVISNQSNCHQVIIDLPKDFVRLDGLLFTHSSFRSCDFSNDTSDDSVSASYLHIHYDFSVTRFSDKFTAKEAKTIARYRLLGNLSYMYKNENIPEIFEQQFNNNKYYCYKERSISEEITYTSKACFTFINGAYLNISYLHSSIGTTSIADLEKALVSVRL